VVIRCDFNDGVVRYELAAGGHHHHHIVCRVCRLTTPIQACSVDALQFLPTGHGYQNITHRLEFFGVCPECSAGTVRQ
jgi:Fur family ferric uptake transcriptional regulator